VAAMVERQRLVAFGAALPKDLIARRDILVRELGEPSETTAVWRGPTSPLESEQLQRMSLTEIRGYLNSWKPLGTFGSASPEGLSRGLQAITRTRALEFSKAADTFIGVEPTYVRGLVTGLSEAVTADQSIEWEKVLELLHWVCSQPIEPEPVDRGYPDDADPGWSWTRLAITRLLENGLTHRQAGLSIQARQPVWALIEILLRDPDPMDGGDARLPDSDYLTRSINSVRGLALTTVVRYAWWIHSEVPVPEGVKPTFDRAPEIRGALERALEDPSPAVRCVLGEYFPSLFYLDSAWTPQHAGAIFPEAPEAALLWKATWSTYVEYAQPYDAAFETLSSKYDLALARLRNAGDAERKKMGERGLGQHLASYFWRAVDGQRSTERLLEYLGICTPEHVGHTLWFLGRGLEEAKDTPQTTIARLMDLWSELRVRSDAWPEQKRQELLRHFGTWFTSDQFDPQWALTELEQSLSTGFGLIDVQAVLVRLGSLAEALPLQVVRCVELLVKNEQQLRYPFMWERELASILKALLASRDPDVQQRARSIADKLVEGGSLFARDLVASPGPVGQT
jgi:hypothetical protein